MAELSSTLPISKPGPGDVIISYLPDAHIANRWGAHYTSIASGMQIVALPDMKQMISVLPTTRPTLFGAVPQVWYKLKAGIEGQLAAETSPVKKRIASWAFEVGRRRARLRSDGKPVPRSLEIQDAIAERLVFSKVRARLGLDRVRFAATGAAAIDPDALEFVLALGLPCCELWGMSELSCAATVNPPDAVRIGTVGTALPNAELRLADDGELLVRGPLVMKGYRNDPEKTAETIDDEGWLHTGDIATIDDDGYVRIVDRKKELMINAAGKNMSPSNIEGTVKVGSPLIGSVVAVGDDRPYVVALITLDPDAADPVRAAARPRPRPEGAGREPGGTRGSTGGRHRRQRTPGPRRADQEVHRATGRLGAGRRRAHPDDEAQAQAHRGEVRRRDRRTVLPHLRRPGPASPGRSRLAGH